MHYCFHENRFVTVLPVLKFQPLFGLFQFGFIYKIKELCSLVNTRDASFMIVTCKELQWQINGSLHLIWTFGSFSRVPFLGKASRGLEVLFWIPQFLYGFQHRRSAPSWTKIIVGDPLLPHEVSPGLGPTFCGALVRERNRPPVTCCCCHPGQWEYTRAYRVEKEESFRLQNPGKPV